MKRNVVDHGNRPWMEMFELIEEGIPCGKWCDHLFGNDFGRYAIVPYLIDKINGRYVTEDIDTWISDAFGMEIPEDTWVYRQLIYLCRDYMEEGIEGGAFYQWRLYLLYEYIQDYNDMRVIDGSIDK